MMSAGSLTISDNSQVYYAYYRNKIINHYYTGSTNSNNYTGTAWSTRTLYKNVFFTSDSALSYVISTSQTGTTNLSHGTGMGNAAFKGFSINGSDFNFSSIAKAAESPTASLYSVYDIWHNSSNSAYYNKLSAAVESASSGNTLTLDNSYLEEGGSTITINKTITLSITNGKTLTLGSNLGDKPITVNDENLTTTSGNLTVTGTGTIISNNERTIYNYGGTLRVYNVTMKGEAIHLTSTKTGAKLYIGKIKTETCTTPSYKNTNCYYSGNVSEGPTITKTSTSNGTSSVVAVGGGFAYINDGTIDNNKNDSGRGIYIQNDAQVYVYGGTITAKGNAIYSAPGCSGYLYIGVNFERNKTINPNSIALTSKNRYSTVGKRASWDSPVIKSTHSSAILLYGSDSEPNSIKLRIYHGFISSVRGSAVYLNYNVESGPIIDGGLLYSSKGNAYHNDGAANAYLTGSARLLVTGTDYAAINTCGDALNINNASHSSINGVSMSKDGCTGSSEYGRTYGTYILSKNGNAIYTTFQGLKVNIGGTSYSDFISVGNTCFRRRDNGTVIAAYKKILSGNIKLGYYVGGLFYNSNGSSSWITTDVNFAFSFTVTDESIGTDYFYTYRNGLYTLVNDVEKPVTVETGQTIPRIGVTINHRITRDDDY